MASDNRYEWGNHVKRKGGYISLDKDKDGLPILQINVDDDYYAGEISHRDLFRMISDIAMDGTIRKVQELSEELPDWSKAALGIPLDISATMGGRLVVNTKVQEAVKVIRETASEIEKGVTNRGRMILLAGPLIGAVIWVFKHWGMTRENVVQLVEDTWM